MRASGYVRCPDRSCYQIVKGYKPVGWKPGDELSLWGHGHGAFESGGDRKAAQCPLSYKPGMDSHFTESQ
jgi:hypothetical protein